MPNLSNRTYCKAGNVELSKEEAEEIYNNKKYVVTSTAIWQPHFSQAQNRIYFSKIADVKGMARRGRFYRMTAREINNVLKQKLLNEEM